MPQTLHNKLQGIEFQSAVHNWSAKKIYSKKSSTAATACLQHVKEEVQQIQTQITDHIWAKRLNQSYVLWC